MANFETPYSAVGDILARVAALATAVRARAEALYDREIARRAAKLTKRQWQAVAITAVALLHVVFVWTIVLSLRTPIQRDVPREIQLSLLRSDPVVVLPSVALTDPETPVIEPPEVVIEADAPVTTAISAASPSQVLAPRPDPARTNPTLAGTDVGSTIATAMAVVMRILVMPDGTISNAAVVRSSGRAEVDAGAVAYVKANWHFLPALLNGAAIKYWTTVSVPIAPASR